MKLSSQIKPISYLKAHAAELVRDLNNRQEPLVITQNGEAKAVMLDVKSYEDSQEMLALLKLLAIGNRQVEEGKVRSVDDAFQHLRDRRSRGE
ncbi:MAG: type II toxin-antitoxin system Phd/YefM family antitoxin [Pseudomonadota bacterium]